MKKILIALAVLVVIAWAPWMVFPAASLQYLIEDSLHNERMQVESIGFEKGFFYTLRAEKAVVRSSGRELLVFDSVRSRINPLGLLRRQLRLTVHGEIGGGSFSGNLCLEKQTGQIALDVKKAAINKIPLLQRTGMQGTGTVSVRVNVMNESGTIVFATDDARFEPSLVAGMKLPLNFFHRATGSLSVKGNILKVESVSLEGKDIFARLKGEIHNALMDMTMELMPGRAFVENPLFLSEFERYKVSPGYYVIPVRGAISL